jgi:lysyl-tRNA synthetase class 2
MKNQDSPPSPNLIPNADLIPDENHIISERRAKLSKIRAHQKSAFPNNFKRDTLTHTLQEKYSHLSKEEVAEITPTLPEFSLGGRIMLKRVMGKASFVTLQDMGGRIQIYVRKEDLGEEAYENFKTWDIGDTFGVKGFLFKTNTGELSIHAKEIVLLVKSLRPLPDKFHGLSDTELKYRQRYVDLMMNEHTKKTFITRSKIIEFIRQYLINLSFLEVETPMLHILPGGAAAKPFKTHHNALDMDMFLRIAPELFLKRLVVGGLERVFEINRNFRNEGLSTRHNPEFTMLEFYQAYSNYEDLMDLTEDLLKKLALSLNQSTRISYQGQEIDFSQPFERVSVVKSILKFNPDLALQEQDLWDLNKAKVIAKNLKINLGPDENHMGLGKVQIVLFEELVEHKLFQPTFITEYPAEVSPLARRNDDNPFITDRFEFFVGGREVANGFSELNDAEDQAERFHQQVQAKAAGDEEAMHYDADYIRALEYGLPPTAGEGIGIDRLVMLFTDAPSIRDVILFPHLRPNGSA